LLLLLILLQIQKQFPVLIYPKPLAFPPTPIIPEYLRGIYCSQTGKDVMDQHWEMANSEDWRLNQRHFEHDKYSGVIGYGRSLGDIFESLSNSCGFLKAMNVRFALRLILQYGRYLLLGMTRITPSDLITGDSTALRRYPAPDRDPGIPNPTGDNTSRCRARW
jgi:hypothetical protein